MSGKCMCTEPGVWQVEEELGTFKDGCVAASGNFASHLVGFITVHAAHVRAKHTIS